MKKIIKDEILPRRLKKSAYIFQPRFFSIQGRTSPEISKYHTEMGK
jgi:hypothetical protein